MFSFLKSESAKLRENAKNWLYVANKVYHFRRDVMSDSESSKLANLINEVKVGMRSSNGESDRLKSSLESMRGHLEQVGGNYYPRSSMAENIEFFFAAIIIYVGFTAFFVKPFKIPTNSMWPTYYGMTGEVYQVPEESPGLAERVFRKVAFGATRFEVVAPADGELLIPLYSNSTGRTVGRYFEQPAKVKRYVVLPAAGKQMNLRVGDEAVSFKVPVDFSVDKEVYDKLFTDNGSNYLEELFNRARRGMIADTNRVTITNASGNSQDVYVSWVRTGKTFKKGETILSFDLMTGDQLFVDRMAYHFVEPKVGDGFVFKTGEIPILNADKFYIKRLAGTPGDKVKIEDGGLIVNGEPATGSEAFELNANKEGDYGSYTFDPPSNGPLAIDLETEQIVPDNSFLGLGDNSFNSYDGRGWGYIPQDSVVGRPVMIYYPFTKRFGLAK